MSSALEYYWNDTEQVEKNEVQLENGLPFLVERPAVRIPETTYHETMLYYDGNSCRFLGRRSKTRTALLEQKLGY
jgi:hypothetical protein